MQKKNSMYTMQQYRYYIDHLGDPAVDPEQFRRDLKTYLFAGHSKH